MAAVEQEQCDCEFPLFRAAYLERAARSGSCGDEAQPSRAQESGSLECPEPFHRGRGLASLDLRALRDARSDGPPSELQARREKYAFFEKQCSEVADGLFLGSDVVARSRETLRAAGVTHVVNCVGFLYPAYFQDELTYLVLYLQDMPMEDLAAVLYDVFDFIEAARSSGGRVLLHCSQGVSRSASLAIAYLMWKRGGSFDEVLAAVKAIRGVANPNIGFTCQLLNWHKRRAARNRSPVLYRIAPQCSSAPLYLVPKVVQQSSLAALDTRGAFILQTQEQTIIWQGLNCPSRFVHAAERAASHLARFEGACSPPVHVREGEACPGLRSWCGAGLDMEEPITACEVDVYNHDFLMFLEADSGSSSPPDSCRTTSSAALDTCRTVGSDGGGSGRAPKTPRVQSADCCSPNHRSRKMRRADSGQVCGEDEDDE